MRRCPDCGEIKPPSEYLGGCKPCHNSRTRASVRRNGGNRHYRLRRRYGVGRPEIDALFREQGGLCAACGANPAEHVDHDHTTGRIRAILGPGCNTGLGKFGDDPDIIARAIAYLERRP